jgi:hypothetical protein
MPILKIGKGWRWQIFVIWLEEETTAFSCHGRIQNKSGEGNACMWTAHARKQLMGEICDAMKQREELTRNAMQQGSFLRDNGSYHSNYSALFRHPAHSFSELL